MFNKVLVLIFSLFFAITVHADSLTSKSKANIQGEIQGLSVSDTKQVISADSKINSNELSKLALNSGVGNQGKDNVVERSMGCSTGCSTGCSVGCSSGCSVGCSSGCSVGCR